MFDADGALVVWNKHYQAILKFPDRVMAVGTTMGDFAQFMAERGDYGPGDPNSLMRERLDWLGQDATTRREVTIPGGRTYDILKTKSDDGGLVITFADITDRKVAAEALHRSESRFRDIADAASDWFWELDADLRFTMVTDTVMQYNGGTNPEAFYGMTRRELNTRDDIESKAWTALYADMAAHRPFRNFEYNFVDANGDDHDWSISGRPVFDDDGKFSGYRGVGRDISARKRMEETLRDNQERLEMQLVALRDREERLEVQASEIVMVAENLAIAEQKMKFLANHDALTGLPSLRLCKDRVDMAIAGARRDKTHCALMFIDLDGFKAVNDTHGHETGDGVLKTVAERILSTIREVDTAARIGGDEFLVVAPGIGGPGDAAFLAERLVRAISADLEVDGAAATIGASIGIALYPIHGETCDELMQQANQAMYGVKRKGKNNFGFVPS
jgi:diguanylate cyclase (GGDEF)-like protein/PAS domain S-box-containing protein